VAKVVGATSVSPVHVSFVHTVSKPSQHGALTQRTRQGTRQAANYNKWPVFPNHRVVKVI